jgi:electron transport complex protein RnfG
MNETTAAPTTPRTPGFRMIRSLGGIAMLSGLVVVLVYQWTLPIIAENQRIATERAVFEVIEGAATKKDFRLGESGPVPADSGSDTPGETVYAAYDTDGRLKGIAMPAAAQGYQDIVKLLYGYDPYCQCIRGIKVLKMTETPGLGDKIIKDPAFLANFDALQARVSPEGRGLEQAIVTVKHGTKTDPWQIDAISGATVTSNTVGKALNKSAQALAPLVQRHLNAFEEARP